MGKTWRIAILAKLSRECRGARRLTAMDFAEGRVVQLAALIGASGRRVFIWPSQDKVVARLGRAPSWKDAHFLAALG